MKISFTKGNWEDKLNYAYTARFPFSPKLIQEKDCIRNDINPEMVDGFDYTTLLLKNKYGKDSTFTATCSFECYGAPLFVFPHDVWEDENGDLRYGDYHEIVVYEDGINVWKLYMVNGEVKYHKIFSANFKLDENTKHCLTVTLLEKAVEISISDKKYYLRIDDLPQSVYAGITACENINRFYDFSVDAK